MDGDSMAARRALGRTPATLDRRPCRGMPCRAGRSRLGWIVGAAGVVGLALLPAAPARAQDRTPPPATSPSTLDLQKKTQNPVADLISVPIQTNFNFGYGAQEAPEPSSTQIITNVQPVVPITLGDTGFNLIARPILPIVRQPDLLEDGDTVGLGDLQVQTFLSPADAGKLIWGVGGVLQPPTATNGKDLGTQKWSAGPAAVVLAMPGKWVYGAVATQLWSFAGKSDREDISLTTVQPFLNYNFGGGWYLSSSPVMTANWKADGNDNTFTVPVGGGGGRLIRIGKLPVNLQAQAFYNVVKPDDDATADWTLRLQVQFLFPK